MSWSDYCDSDDDFSTDEENLSTAEKVKRGLVCRLGEDGWYPAKNMPAYQDKHGKWHPAKRPPKKIYVDDDYSWEEVEPVFDEEGNQIDPADATKVAVQRAELDTSYMKDVWQKILDENKKMRKAPNMARLKSLAKEHGVRIYYKDQYTGRNMPKTRQMLLRELYTLNVDIFAGSDAKRPG